MEAQIDRPELPQKDRAYFHFAMAHAYEKEKRFKTAFIILSREI